MFYSMSDAIPFSWVAYRLRRLRCQPKLPALFLNAEIPNSRGGPVASRAMSWEAPRALSSNHLQKLDCQIIAVVTQYICSHATAEKSGGLSADTSVER